jgi:hypothetical protein
MFLQSGTMTGTFCFMTGTNSLVLVILTGRSPKIISRLDGRRHLAIPANSASTERLFSKAGQIVTAKRVYLKPSQENMLT